MFLINSRHPLACAPHTWLPKHGAPFSRSYGGILPSSFNVVLSSALVYSTSPPVSVSGTVSRGGYFLELLHCPINPIRSDNTRNSSHTHWPTNINVVPIDYGFRPRLRGRLTLSGLALLRNPWTFGESVSHTLYRYSCQHSHFRYLQAPSQVTLHRPTERSATTQPKRVESAASVYGLSPGTSSAQADLIRPVSYYAFFKGWLLLSQPPGCFGLPTSLPT